jgi:glycosyltransferase involved in cell wall biosynthesis
MRILYIFRSLAVWGGIERILVEKMNYLSSVYGYDVYMITSDQGNHPIPYHLEGKVHFDDLNVRFHQQYQYNIFKRKWLAKKLKRIYEQRLGERIQYIRPDIIVCTTADYIDSLIKLKGTIPMVVESHSICLRTIEDGRYWLQRKWNKHLYLTPLSKVDVIVALTEGDANEWRKIHPHVVVIPNIVHLNKGTASTLKNKRVIWVGRFDYQKRPLEMVKIWEKIQPQFPDWQLDMYGEGEQRQELENKARSLGMNIVIHQPTEGIFDRYRESSVLVSTSLFEPFGLVIPEAMSCGLPVVAYDCPYGPANIISDGTDGFLIMAGNVDGYAVCVCQLIENEELRKQIGKVAILSAQCYHADVIMPQWKRLFEMIIANSN